MIRADAIRANLDDVRQRLRRAVLRAGRRDEDVRLLAVSKTMPAEDIVHALAAGQTEFAESYGQEFRDKKRAVAEQAASLGLPAPHWHFIGPLQSNKVKYVAGQVGLIHSLGSTDIVVEVERKAASMAVTQDCLVQVNVAGEAQKSGLPPAELGSTLDRFAELGHLRCRGLMIIPPYDEDPERSRVYFRALRRLAEEQRRIARAGVELVELSMGMSHDLEVAIAEGATMVRVGTAIFGARQ